MAEESATLLLKIKDMGSKGLGKVKAAIGGIAKAAAVATTAVAAFVGASIAKFREQELSVNKLNQAMVNNGDFSVAASKDMQAFATELQKASVFGDELILSQLALAKSFGVSNDEAKKMISAASNLASATGMSLESAVKNLGKTMSGLTGELGESIPALRDLTAEQLKSGAAIDLVAEKFAGSNEAVAAGTGGMQQMTNALGDVMEVIGKAFAPMIVAISKQIKEFAEGIQENEDALRGLAAVATFVSQTFAVLKNTIATVGAVIGTGLAAAVESVTLLTQGQFSRAKEVATLGMEEVGTIVKDAKTTLAEELAAIDEAAEIQEQEKKAREVQMFQISESNKTRIVKQEGAKRIKEKAKQDEIEAKAAAKKALEDKKLEDQKIADQRSTFSTISTLASSNNKVLAGIGKAAALTQIAIDGPMAVTRALGAFPPPLNFALAGAVGAAVAAQAARVAGVPLADGGIIAARTGGIQATIGEGGRDEAVIPLDDAGGGIGGVTLNFNGNFIAGGEADAREFAEFVDSALLELRRDNQSNSFDQGVI